MDRYKERVQQTVQDLSYAIYSINQKNPIKFVVKPHTTNSFAVMQDQYAKTGVLEVSSDGCQTSIYGNAFMNILARVFHDRVHLTRNLSFSKNDELQTAKLQRGEVFNECKLLGMSNLRASRAAALLYIDIADQVKYYYKYHQFVENQYEYIMERFKRYLTLEQKSTEPDNYLKVFHEFSEQIH